VPACCFVIVAFYGFNWPRLSAATPVKRDS